MNRKTTVLILALISCTAVAIAIPGPPMPGDSDEQTTDSRDTPPTPGDSTVQTDETNASDPMDTRKPAGPRPGESQGVMDGIAQFLSKLLPF